MTPVTRLTLKAALALAIVATLLAPLPASAQTLYGSITGTVADQQGAAIPGATVTATNTGTGLQVTAVTDADGGYTFRNLLPGVYDLNAALQGFRTLNQTGLRVSAGNPVRVELKLEVGTLAETVNVVSETTLLQTEKADLSTELTSKEIVNLPLNQFRNYQKLIDLVPGATPSGLQNAEIDTPGRALTTNVNGTQRNSNAFRLDGAVSVNVWLPHHVGYVNPAETIDTVNISTNNFDADQGMAAGAAVNVVTKSGTNQLRGSAFLFRQQDELNANTFANNANNLSKPDLSNSIYGGTLGGPIMKNKLFFFGSWERYQARRGTQSTYTVPTAAMRAGNFSEVAAAYPAFRLYNPYTGGAGGVGRQEFPNYTIPGNLLNPTSQSILSSWPSPNTQTDINRNGLADDYVVPRTITNDRDNFDIKLTWQRNSSHSIWGKFSMLDAEVVDNFILGFDNGSLGDTRVYVGTIGHTWTLSPSLVLDGNIGINRQDQTVTGPDYGTNYGLNAGIPGTNGPTERESGIPRIEAGYVFGTTPGWMPLFRKESNYTFTTSLTKVLPKHELRFGIDVVKLELDHWQPEFGYAIRGRLDFGGLGTATPGYTALQWNNFATYMLGLQTYHAKDVQEINMSGREWQTAFYIRDRWSVTDKLTLSLGLRFEYYPLMTRADDKGLERLDYNTYEVLLGGYGDTPKDVGISHKSFYIAPRLGAMYRLTEKTVLRAGYGRTFNPVPWSRPLRGSFPYDIFYNNSAENYAFLGPIQQGIPAVPVPDLSSGRTKLPPNTYMRSPNPNDVDKGVIQQWNVAVEQRIPGDIAIELAYVGSATDGGYADQNLNYGQPGGGQTSRQYYSVAGTTDVVDWAGRTKSRYSALQVALNRPFRNGLLLKGAYTLSEAKNETDDDGWAGLTWNHPIKLDDNFALAGFDRTHVFQLGFVYELPFAKESSGVLAQIVKNWQLNGVLSAYSGSTYSIGGSNPELNCPGCGSVFINVNGDPEPIGTPGSSTEPYYDKSLFSQPTGTSVDGFGTSARNQFRRPAVSNVNLGIFRAFPVGRFRPEIRVDITNLFNHTSWGAPVTGFTDPRFMTFIPSGAHNGTQTGERQVQIGLRLEF